MTLAPQKKKHTIIGYVVQTISLIKNSSNYVLLLPEFPYAKFDFDLPDEVVPFVDNTFVGADVVVVHHVAFDVHWHYNHYY